MSDLRSHHDRLASSRPPHAIRKSIGINSDSRITTTARPPWCTCDRLTCDALRPISDRPTTWARPPHVTCLTLQKFAWDQNLCMATDLRSCRMTYEAIEWFTSHPLHPIHNRSRNKRRNLWVGRSVSSWWPWFPSRSSVLIIYICMCIPYMSSVTGHIYIYIYIYTTGVSFSIGETAPHHVL